MRAEITTRAVVYSIQGMDAVTVSRGVHYANGLTMDLYYPPDPAPLLPAVVMVLGYPDVGVAPRLGCQFREMAMSVSWGQLFAASGMVGVLYETRSPVTDVEALLAALCENGPALGIDAARIGIWSASGNVPVALSVLMDGKVRCGALCYGFMLNAAEAAGQFHFANPVAGRRVEDLPSNTALFIARAGQDQFAGVNESIDAFVPAALQCNLPLTLVNHPSGPHAFDLMDDSEASRDVIRSILAFLRANLAA